MNSQQIRQKCVEIIEKPVKWTSEEISLQGMDRGQVTANSNMKTLHQS